MSSSSLPPAGDRALFFDLSLDMHCVASPEAKLLHLNSRWEDVLGFSLKELKAGQFLDLVHPDDIQSTLDAMSQLNEGKPVIHFTNRYRTRGGSYRWFEWSSTVSAADGLYYATARDVTDQRLATDELRTTNRILAFIQEAQEFYLSKGMTHIWWDRMLAEILEITEGEYGFIGAIEADESGEYLRTFAITDISWDEQTRAFFLSGREDGLEFRNLDTLFGKVITTRDHVIANDVASDPRSGGRPAGHPPLKRFLGLALHGSTGLVGMIGLANRKAPYDGALIESLSPITSMLSALIESRDREVKGRSAIRQARDLQEMNSRILDSTESFIFVTDLDGKCLNANRRTMTFAKLAPGDEPALVRPLELLGRDGAWLVKVREGLSERAALREEIDASSPGSQPIPCEFTITELPDGSGMTVGLLFVGVEVSTRRELAASAIRAATLQSRVEALRRRQGEDERISTCVEFLLNSHSLEESQEIVFRYLRDVFSGASLTMYGVDREAELLEVLWSVDERDVGEAISFTDCWAARSRRTHTWWAHSPHLRCAHMSGDEAKLTVCTPLQYHDRVFGMVTFAFDELDGLGMAEQAEVVASREKRLAEIAQRISIALATVELRVKLEHAALTDALTGLCNRRAFEQAVRRSMAREQRHGLPYAFGILDIDLFKKVNDGFGHDVGDALLQQLSELLRAATRRTDTVGRLGGEEFGILLEGVNPEEAAQKFEHLRATIEAEASAGDRRITASFGFVHSSQATTRNWSAIYAATDRALYRAKATGRNRVEEVGTADFRRTTPPPAPA